MGLVLSVYSLPTLPVRGFGSCFWARRYSNNNILIIRYHLVNQLMIIIVVIARSQAAVVSVVLTLVQHTDVHSVAI